MEHPYITLFKPVLTSEIDEGVVSYLLQHPVLTSPYYTTLLENWAKTLKPQERHRAERALTVRAEVFEKIRDRKLRTSIPIFNDLAIKVFEGKYTLQYAQQVASQPEFFVELTYPDVTSVCDNAEKVARGNWRTAVILMRLLFAALDARRAVITENQEALDLTTIESWLTVACVACSDVPDGRIFRDAVARADAVADLDGDSDPPANILHRLGVLHLDPYVAGRLSENFDAQLRAWQQRLVEELGEDFAGIADDELHLPHINDALPKAAAYFRRAAARRSGEARGQTLKALAQTLLWTNLIELPHDHKECTSAAREALELLPRDRFRAEHAELNRIVERGKKHSPEAVADKIVQAQELLATPIDKWVEQENETGTINIFRMNANAIANAAPELALKLYMTIEGLIRSKGEARRNAYDEALLRTAIRAYGSPQSIADGTPLSAKLERLFDTAQRERWSQKKVAYTLLALAYYTTGTNQEGEGLQALGYCSHVAENIGHEPVLQRCIPFLRVILQVGDAVNAVDAKQFGRASSLYANAIDGNLQVAQPLAALDIVRRLVDLATPGKLEAEAALEALIAGLVGNALSLEYQAGEAATALIQSVCRTVVSILTSKPAIEIGVILPVLDVAKGRRFRAALTEPEDGLAWLNNPRTLAAEKELLELRSQIQSESTTKPVVFNQNTLLAGYVSSSEMRGGANAAEQLGNLQIQFDTRLDKHLGSDQNDGWIPDIEKLRLRLDDKVVLLIQYVGTNLEGALNIITLLFSKEDTAAAQGICHEIPARNLLFSSGEQSFKGSILTYTVGQLRDQLVSPPGPRAADTRALNTLIEDCEVYLGGLIQAKLQAFRAAGKDHLCISSHGALHFYPFHLLGREDEPLAREWCVTYLPHPYLLERQQATTDGKVELTSIGINFAAGNAHHLDSLEESESEARAIAAEYVPLANLLIGSAANKHAVFGALTSSRQVHISTHGLHNVSAPSFQCIFLHPGAKDDGILYAYELLRLDLRGLDLVTFSACETALGRFDIGDNLRGIPAALLIAGVSTIVGTLWNVETNTATYFFTSFYRILRKTGSKRTAFYEAQTKTRREFPKYRDWGAFQFIGSWS